MRYILKGEKADKVVDIPILELDTLQKNLGISQQEAIELWLTDNGFESNQEQEELDKTAKGVRIAGVGAKKCAKTSKKAHKVKVSAEKIELFSEILSDLEDVYKGNVTILTENRQISCKIGEKSFKITITEDRK